MNCPASEISHYTACMLAVRDRRDRVAFAVLFDHFAPRLKGFVMRTGMKPEQAEEIVQEVMLTVWHKAEQFDPAARRCLPGSIGLPATGRST